MTSADAKARWREQAIASRRSRTDAERATARASNSHHLRQQLARARTVCAFLSLPSEPLDPALLDDLVQLGVRVLVPVVAAGQPLDWVGYPTSTRPGSLGIAEPSGPRLGAQAVADADAVIVPAFAVDAQGVRLGRGGGHYDRTLALLEDRTVEVVAVLFDDERPTALPAEPHDRRVTAVVTPTGGWQSLPTPDNPERAR